MNTNRNTLALRRQSIRTLTPSELLVVHGGDGSSISAATGTSVAASTKQTTSNHLPSGASIGPGTSMNPSTSIAPRKP